MKKMKKVLATVLAVAMMMSLLSVSAFAAESTTYGSKQTALTAGTYAIDVTLMKEDGSEESMSNACIAGASLVIGSDGTATMVLDLQAMTVYGVTAWGSAWSIYTDYSAGTVEACTVLNTDADGNDTQVSFVITDTAADGIYMQMNGRSTAYLSIDYTSATLAAVALGSADTALAVGTYTVSASLMNASDITTASAAASCVQAAYLNVAKDGTVTVTLDIGAASMMGYTAYASDWKVYTDFAAGTTEDATVVASDEDDHVSQISFTLSDLSADGVYVNMYVAMMGYAPNAYLAIDYTTAAAVESFTVGNYTYEVTGANTVTITGATKKSLKTIKVANTVTYAGNTFKVTAIAKNAFKGYSSATKVTIGKNVKKIGKNAFKGINKKATIKPATKKVKKLLTSATGVKASMTIK